MGEEAGDWLEGMIMIGLVGRNRTIFFDWVKTDFQEAGYRNL